MIDLKRFFKSYRYKFPSGARDPFNCFFGFVLLTLILSFLNGVKKGEAYYIFILYILIFCLLRTEKVSVFKVL